MNEALKKIYAAIEVEASRALNTSVRLELEEAARHVAFAAALQNEEREDVEEGDIEAAASMYDRLVSGTFYEEHEKALEELRGGFHNALVKGLEVSLSQQAQYFTDAAMGDY